MGEVNKFWCEVCKKSTLQIEQKVVDKESSTVWVCLECGNERRPKGGNAMVLA